MDPETLEDEQEEEANLEIETLPLFPMHGEDGIIKPESEYGYYNSGQYWPSTESASASRAALELSLNSCITGRSTGLHWSVFDWDFN